MTTLETQQKNEIDRLKNEVKGLVEHRDKVKAQRNELRNALTEFKAAFIVAVGDKSPFAKQALGIADRALNGSNDAKDQTNEIH